MYRPAMQEKRMSLSCVRLLKDRSQEKKRGKRKAFCVTVARAENKESASELVLLGKVKVGEPKRTKYRRLSVRR